MRAFSLDDLHKPAAPADVATPRRRLLVQPIDLERVNCELIQLWLAAEGWDIEFSVDSDHGAAIVLIEIAFPRREDRQRVHTLSSARPGVPVVVLSPTFFPDVPGQGRVAHELGATAVLAMPLQRERLLAVVRDLLSAVP
jgi:AmiR/NasT family two-component response regulator